jgi:hypothetical protein
MAESSAMAIPKRARSWKRRTQPRGSLTTMPWKEGEEVAREGASGGSHRCVTVSSESEAP